MFCNRLTVHLNWPLAYMQSQQVFISDVYFLILFWWIMLSLLVFFHNCVATSVDYPVAQVIVISYNWNEHCFSVSTNVLNTCKLKLLSQWPQNSVLLMRINDICDGLKEFNTFCLQSLLLLLLLLKIVIWPPQPLNPDKKS